MGLRKSFVGLFTFAGGLAGLVGGFLLITITSVYVYPMDTQGKPYFSLPGFVPILDLLMIILSAIMSIVGMTVLCVLPRLHHPLWEWDAFTRATHDKFFIVIEANDPRFNEKTAIDLLREIGGTNLTYHRRRGMKLRYVFLGLALAVIGVVAIAGFRGPAFAQPPLELFPDMIYQDKVKDQQPERLLRRRQLRPRAHSRHRGRWKCPRRTITGPPAIGTTRHWGDGIPVHDAVDGGRPLQIDDANMARGRERYNISCVPATARRATGRGSRRSTASTARPNYHIDRLRQESRRRALRHHLQRQGPDDGLRLQHHHR